MKNTSIHNLIIIFLFLSITSIANAQTSSNNRTGKVLNSLEEITITVDKTPIENTLTFRVNKRVLRKAARKSKGDIDKFISQIKNSVPSIGTMSETKWGHLYNASRLLTFTGKVEELPSVL